MLSKIPVLGRLFRGGAAASGPVHVLRLHGVISPTRSNGPLGGSGPVLNLESLAADGDGRRGGGRHERLTRAVREVCARGRARETARSATRAGALGWSCDVCVFGCSMSVWGGSAK